MSTRSTTACSALQFLEALPLNELDKVGVESLDTAASGLARYAKIHFGSLLPVSSEQPEKVAKQIKGTLQLDIPPIYACALASGSNWWQTAKYSSSRGYTITTAEADMMIEKAFFFFEKHMAAIQMECHEERDVTISKMLNAKRLHEELHREKPLDEIPKYARNPDRWPAYLKLIGRSLPFDTAWDMEWFEFQKDSFHVSMQARKLKSGCIFYAILIRALQIDPDLVCAETNEETKYGVGIKTEEALRLVTSGISSAEMISQAGQNVLGRAYHRAMKY